MRRVLLCLVGCLALGVNPATQQPARPPEADDVQQRPLFRGGARFVRVDVYPTDREGRPIEGLTAADFEVFEDGKPQAIDTFEFIDIEPDVEEARVDPNTQAEGDALAKDPRARVFVVVLDTRHVNVLGGARMRRPLINMLDRLIGPRDVFGVITPQMRPRDLMLGRQTLTASDMLERHWVWGTGDSIGRPDQFQNFFEGCFGDARQNPLVRELILRARERETLTHLDGLVERLGAIREEKKAVIIVTQGWTRYGPNTSAANSLRAPVPGIYTGGGRIGTTNRTAAPGQQNDASQCFSEASRLLNEDTARDFRALFERAQRANVSFYPVDPRGLAVFDSSIDDPLSPSADMAVLREKRNGLQEIALNTDGLALMHSNDIDGEIQRLANSLSTYYLIGYYSANTKTDGGFRKIEVKVRQPGARVKARRGYFAPTEAELADVAAGRAAADAPVSGAAAALSEALGRLDTVRHDRDLFIQATRLPGAVIVSAELGVNARTDASWAGGGEMRLVVSGAGADATETRPLAARQSGVVIRVPVEGTGAVRVDARARGGGSGAIGAADATLAVPAAEPSLIGGVLSFRGIARALMPAADGRYRRTERATLEAPLGDGAVPVGARLLDRAGKPLPLPAPVRERVDAAGVRWMAAEVVLAPLTDGDYVVELEAMKDEVRERKLFAIRVVR